MKKAKELTPFKAVLIYSLAFVLVVFFELPRVLSWVGETRWKLASGQVFDYFAANVNAVVSRTSDQAQQTDRKKNDPDGQTDSESMGAAQPAAPENGALRTEDEEGKTEDATRRMGGAERNPSDGGGQRAEDGGTVPPRGTSPPKLKPRGVLLVGDSMIAEGFGPALERRLRKLKSLNVVRKGQYSTGFVNQEDFDWPSTLKELIQQNKPDMIVIHMGTNDPIDIIDDSGKRLYFGSEKWKEVYASRVRKFLKFTSESKGMAFWVGLPIMGSNKYCAKIGIINSIFEQECGKVSGCVYVDSWSMLADPKGNYTAFIKGPGGKQTRIRAKDNVHLTEVGGTILADDFLHAACEYVDLPYGDEQGRAAQ